MSFHWENGYAQRIQRMKSSSIRELLKLTEQPDIISFAGGLPAPEVFPVTEIAEVTQRIFHERGAQALQYAATEGYYPLRKWIASQMSSAAQNVKPENVLITSGSQQALDLLGKVFLDTNDTVLVESPTYMGALQAWNAYEARYLTVPNDEQGMQVEYVEDIVKHSRLKWIYILPNFQNPGGVTLSLERRHQLVKLAKQYAIPLIEDDPYAQLRFEGETLPSLFQLVGQTQPQAEYQGNVCYLGTFSKTLAPGLRLGWMVAPTQIIHKFVQAKQGMDLHTSSLNQMIAYEIAQSGVLDSLLEKIRRTYRERRDTMLAAMAQHFPVEAHWTKPEGGMFLWVTLPKEISAEDLLKRALEQKVAFVPGSSFHAEGGGDNTMRLNFSNARPEQIVEGIARLGMVLQTTNQTSQVVSMH